MSFGSRRSEPKITNYEFVNQLIHIAENVPTKYMWGTFGSPISEDLIRQKVLQYPNNYSIERQSFLFSLAGQTVWAFDCIGLIKGVLWGWSGEASEPYGGAVYTYGGIPDATAEGFLKLCKPLPEISESIPVGAVLFLPEHIGVYVGAERVVEATLGKRGDGVVFSALSDAGWRSAGLLPWLTYAAM